MRYSSLGLFFLIALTCCAAPQDSVITVPRVRENLPTSEDLTLLTIDFSRELLNKHRLVLYDTAITYEDRGIKKLRLDYISQASVELKEGRDVIVDVAEGFLDRINSHPSLNGAFIDGPANVENLDIHITYQSFFNKYVDNEYLAYIILERGMSFFYSSELNMDYTDYWTKKIEPYFRTLQISNFQRDVELSYKPTVNESEEILSGDRLYDRSVDNLKKVHDNY